MVTPTGFCPQCGIPREPGARYCRQCGYDLAAIPASTAPGSRTSDGWTLGSFALLALAFVLVAAIAGVGYVALIGGFGDLGGMVAVASDAPAASVQAEPRTPRPTPAPTVSETASESTPEPSQEPGVAVDVAFDGAYSDTATGELPWLLGGGFCVYAPVPSNPDQYFATTFRVDYLSSDQSSEHPWQILVSDFDGPGSDIRAYISLDVASGFEEDTFVFSEDVDPDFGQPGISSWSDDGLEISFDAELEEIGSDRRIHIVGSVRCPPNPDG